RQFGEPPEGTRITVKSHPHDFGSYRSVAVVYNPDDETSVQYAYNVECNVPANWDTEALVELGRKTDCPACGCQIEKLWQFCAGCGHKLK
ncbi:MAG: hypothetical protein KGI50_08110, partial [Patescibacteria group bacterium]|nr:hypothetical protein [Patescibacteria group bacterium]